MDKTTTESTSFLAELTADELEALARRGFVTTIEAIEPSQEFPGFEAGATAADLATAKSQEADELEAGDVTTVTASAMQFALAQDAEFRRRHKRVCEERHRCRVAGLPQPSLPKPPPWAVAAERSQHEGLRERHLSRARTLRSEARSVRRPRPRGAGRPKGRSAARRSSERSGDSGSEGGESEPAHAGRLCICPCARDISHKRAGALYFDPEACRKRHKRALDKAHPDRVVARKLKRLAIADGLEQLVAEELPRGCRCDGEGYELDPEGVPVCVPCGRPLTVDNRAVNGYDRRLAEVRGWMRNERVESRQVHRRHRPNTWRTRPTRKMAAKLRKTRNPEAVAATKRKRAA